MPCLTIGNVQTLSSIYLCMYILIAVYLLLIKLLTVFCATVEALNIASAKQTNKLHSLRKEAL